jgi:hypothetical protein
MVIPFFTIGHSTRPIGEFIDLLAAWEVDLIVDVRTVPRSRTNPQYDRETLPGSLSGRRCHRRIIADYLLVGGERVFHILGSNAPARPGGPSLRCGGSRATPCPATSRCVAQSLPIDSRYDKNDVMVECRIANCGKKVQAKGLCSAHYARQRRGGDPSVKRKSGPKRDAARAIVLALFSDWSPRTQARYWKAHSQLQWVDGIQGTNSLETCIKACSRPNGSINVLEFERRAESIAAAFIVRSAPGQAPPPG